MSNPENPVRRSNAGPIQLARTRRQSMRVMELKGKFNEELRNAGFLLTVEDLNP
jgi:hypothetical protein